MTERKEQFTPGPWQAYTAQHAAWVDTDWKDCAEQTNICDCGKDNGWNDVHLIAAAPDVYYALKDLMNAMDDVLCNADRVPDCIFAVVQEAQDKATAALKKARGEK